MEIKEEYIRKYWERIVADQTEAKYASEGYEVTREVNLEPNMRADMIIEKDGKKTIVEILSRHIESIEIIKLKKWAQEHDYSFILIYANYAPIERKLEFENFSYLFTEYLNEEHQSEFDEFGSYTNAEDVLDVEFGRIEILEDSIAISGCCTIELNSRFDNEGDTEFVYYVPCKFDITCMLKDKGWVISEVNELEINTSQLDK